MNWLSRTADVFAKLYILSQAHVARRNKSRKNNLVRVLLTAVWTFSQRWACPLAFAPTPSLHLLARSTSLSRSFMLTNSESAKQLCAVPCYNMSLVDLSRPERGCECRKAFPGVDFPLPSTVVVAGWVAGLVCDINSSRSLDIAMTRVIRSSFLPLESWSAAVSGREW